MLKMTKAVIRSLALAVFLYAAWANAAAGPGAAYRRLPDVPGGDDPNGLTITRTQVIAATRSGLFTRSLGGSAWTPSQDTGNWISVFPLLPNGDTLFAENDRYEVFLSTNRAKSWTPTQFPGDPLLLCPSGFFCRRTGLEPEAGLYVSRDLGMTWVKLSSENVTSLAVWKNGVAGATVYSQVFKMDPATGARTPLNANLPPDLPGSLFNVGDSLFAQSENQDRLFKCQAGNERWIPILPSAGSPTLSLGHSPFGLTRSTADSVFWSRDFGKTWRRYPAPLNSGYTEFVPEENRLWATTNPIGRMDADGTSWVMDVAGMHGMAPAALDARGSRLFVRSDWAWYQTVSPDSTWVPDVEPEGGNIHFFPTGLSVYLTGQGANNDKMIRIDPDGRRITYPITGDHLLEIFAGSRDRIYVSYYNAYPPLTGSFQVAAPNAQTLTDRTPFKLDRPMDWFAMDGDRIITGISARYAWPPFYSPDAGNTWDTCPIPGRPRVNAMIFAGGAFLGFTSGGLYRSADPPAGWTRMGDTMELMLARGDTVVARDPTRLLLTLDGGRVWRSVENPYAPNAIRSVALAWGSICLIDTGGAASHGILCGSLSDVATNQVDGVHPALGRSETIPKLRLRWGRIEGVLPGGRGPAVSAGIDGRIRPAVRSR